MDSRAGPVVEEANENRRLYEAFCRSLSPRELESPIPATTWRVKDYVAHLASIDIYVADWFEHLADGKRFRARNDDGSSFNIDTWNESRITERIDAPLDDLFGEAARHRERLWNAVDRFSPQLLDEQFSFHDSDITYIRYLQLWVAHDPAHSVDMLCGLSPERRDAALDGWLKKYRM